MAESHRAEENEADFAVPRHTWRRPGLDGGHPYRLYFPLGNESGARYVTESHRSEMHPSVS